MTKTSTTQFDSNQATVMEINAMGPYNHGTWKNNGIEIGNEESLKGRAKAIVESFYQTIISTYTLDQIKEMTLCDIGCYDGYLTTEIEKLLPFKKIIGIEPRAKNIKKGQTIRDFLNIKTTVEFRQGSIETLTNNNENFDIVFISGVFHHLENIAQEIKNLYKITKTALFIETQCYSTLTNNSFIKSAITNFNNRVIEPKDLIYNFIPKQVGLAGFKIETNYFDGSANRFSCCNRTQPRIYNSYTKYIRF